MTTEPTAPVPTPTPTRSARLLDVIRKLIDYGKELATTIRRRAFTDPTYARTHFGTTDIARILAMISRGLHRANALEARITRSAARLDGQPRGAAAPRKPRATPAAAAPAAVEAEPRLLRLPTPDQIDAEVRRRPIGAVLADICRDLGIMQRHPLWRDLQLLMIENGGNPSQVVMDMLDRSLKDLFATCPPDMVFTWPDPPPPFRPPPRTPPP